MSSCESCGMPLNKATESSYDPVYCIYCQDQSTGTLKSYNEVRVGSINAAMKLMGKTQVEAANMADRMLPKLPRWKRA